MRLSRLACARRPGALIVAAALAACGGGDTPRDGAPSDGTRPDAVTSSDGATDARGDAPAPPMDAVIPPSDAVAPMDAVTPGMDVVTPPMDVPAPPMCPPPGPVTANSTVPGALTVPNPTLRNLTLVWAITGDADNDGVVTVRYRAAGTTAWRQGLPLRRTPAGANEGFSWPNRHAGSVFDLEPDTAYEVELALRDPDGGCETRTVMARTRPVPAPMAGAPVRAVTPANFTAMIAAAAPGDILELGPGTYPAFTFARDGMLGRPIVLRGTAGATVMGNIDMFNRQHVHLVGLTVRGRIRSNGGRDNAFVRNTVTTAEDGIVIRLRAEDCYIADNVVTGATSWNAAALGVSGMNIGEGILVTGPGHVIEHNRVTGFRDNISLLEGSDAVDQWSIDIVENEINGGADDGVEADFCFHNCRVVRNRLTNVFMGISAQPSLGGPTYFVRNAMYNVVYQPFKLQRGSVGDVLLHNTSVKSGDAFAVYDSSMLQRAFARNNLFLGGPGGTYGGYSNGTGRVIDLRTAQPSCDLDYDGFGSTTGMFTGALGATRFNSLAELRAMTTERHAVAVDLTVFAASVAFPAMPFPAAPAADLRPRAGGAAVDVGVALPNINDAVTGAGPDLGAHEAGAPLPAYGPR